MASRRYKLSGGVYARTIAGMLCGFLLGVFYQQALAPCIHVGSEAFGQSASLSDYASKNNYYNAHAHFRINGQRGNPAPSNKGQIFVGVMTARKFLKTRVVAAHQTWATTIPGRVMFFSSEGSEQEAPPDIPVVGIPGVDDSYPPQKKSFLLLKYMHDYFIDDYEWFMRADDDVYVKGDRLSVFLNSINSSRPLFIGQAGLGNKDEFGQLSLDRDENFCMGGPGMIFSRRTLRLVVPHISYCLKNLYTTHEDVEIGRCVQRFAGVSCTWAFEMQQLFYQNHIEPNGSFTHPLKVREVHRALTLHPVKNHHYQFRLHTYLQTQESADLRHDLLLLERDIATTNRWLTVDSRRDVVNATSKLGLSPTLMKHVPLSRSEVLSWQFIDHSLFSHTGFNPKRGMDVSSKSAFDNVVLQVMELINQNARQRGRVIDFKDILYGYRRVSPMHGADYILDLLLVYRKFKGRKMTVPVRRHAYLQQTFSDVEFIEDGDLRADRFDAPSQDGSTVAVRTKRSTFFQILHNNIVNLPFIRQPSPIAVISPDDVTQTAAATGSHGEQLHFILPLMGRYKTFLQFMANFEDVCLSVEAKVALAVMLFHGDAGADRTADTIDCIGALQVKYPQHDLRVVQLKGAFSRGLALEQGSRLFSPDALLVFIDVDIYMRHSAVDRLRWNAVRSTQVYYPVVFSQYDPDMTCEGKGTCRHPGPFHFATDIGYWRRFGFGIASMYNVDFHAIGGFDTSIQGWGKEDVDLYTKFLTSNFTVFRAIDPGLVHIFHPILCDPNLESAQYKMCLGSRASSFGSQARLTDIVYRSPEILYKDEVSIDAAAANKDEEGPNSFLNVHQEFDGNNKEYDDVHGR